MQASLIEPESLADQRTIVEQVFETMVGISLESCEADPCETDHLSSCAANPSIASLLTFTAPCEGSILVECSPGLAFLFTARLMSIKLPVSLDEDVADAMRELANMIGGNLKGLMPDETCVSIPRVLTPPELADLFETNEVLSQICFSALSGTEQCSVRLLQQVHPV
jgi:CheY-specific phosphatase CheX